MPNPHGYTQNDVKLSMGSNAPQHRKPKPFNEVDAEAQPPSILNTRNSHGVSFGPYQITLDVFAQVALYLTAPDILALARTTKPIRKLLMRRPSAHIWRTAIANMEGLPCCPIALSEPKYVALLFTTNCTQCGQNIQGKIQPLDVNLLVRMCGPCRLSSYIECTDILPKNIRTLVRVSRDTMFSLRAEVEEVKNHMSVLSASGGEAALEAWKSDTEKAMKLQREVTKELASFNSRPERPLTQQEAVRHAEIKRRLSMLGWTQEDMLFYGNSQKAWMEIMNMNTPVTDRHWKKIHPRLIALLKSNINNCPTGRKAGPSNAVVAGGSKPEGLDRHSEIKRRLEILGWTPKDMDFPEDKRNKWLQIMNMNTPVTDKHWAKICPRLVALLEANRQGRPVREHAQRRETRRVRLESLWKAKKTEMEALNKSNSQSGNLAEAVSQISRLVPIPELSDALEWPVLKQLTGDETPVAEVETRFAQRQGEIDVEITKWCAGIKATLADLLREGLSKSGYFIGEQILGTISQDVKSNPFGGLSPEMQLFLRADSIFSDHANLTHYDNYLNSLRFYVGHYAERDKLKLLDTSKLRSCSVASAVTRAILRSLGRPENISFLELRLRDEYFVCGRCDDDQPKSWKRIVEYYTKKEKAWTFMKAPSPWFAQNGLACHHIHDTNSDNVKPLVRLLTAEERDSLENKLDDKKGDWLLLKCILCERGRAPSDTMIRPHMLNHLRDVHEVEDSLLADPNARLLKFRSRNFYVLRPDDRCDYYGFSSGDERRRVTKSERGSDYEDSEAEDEEIANE